MASATSCMAFFWELVGIFDSSMAVAGNLMELASNRMAVAGSCL